MNKKGPIVVIEDSIEDEDDLKTIFRDLNLKNEIVFFNDGQKVLDYLNQTDIKPFLILSDIDMPKITGFEVRQTVFTNEQLKAKCIPYLFFTTRANKKIVTDAYAISVQGFFQRPADLTGLANTIRKIVEYWQECIAPGEYE